MFLDLPEDIRVAICAYISPEDLLVLKQTCRGLHAFVCSDYVSHQMRVDLPLDLPSDRDVRSLPNSQFQRVIIKALRLEHNWRHDVSYIRQCRKLPVPDDGLVLQMQLVMPNCLVCLSRSQISVWNIERIGYLVASLKTHRSAVKFSAAAQAGSQEITIAIVERGRDDVPTRTEQVNVYSVTVVPNEGVDCDPRPGGLRHCHRFILPEYNGTVSDVSVCGHIVGASIAKFSAMTYPPSYEILLINTVTGAKLLLDPKLPPTFERLALVVYPSCFVLVGVEQGTILMARIYALPSAMLLKRRQMPLGQESVVGSSDCPVFHDDNLLTSKKLFFSPKDFDFHVSAWDGASSNLSIVAFDIEFRPEQTRGYVFHVAFQDLMQSYSEAPEVQSTLTVRHFDVPAKTSVDKVCLGKTGRRAIWLQRHWDTDEFDVMKGSFSAPPKVGALFPRHLAFPFGPLHACQSLAFDEAIGRVVISLLTGQLYVVDY